MTPWENLIPVAVFAATFYGAHRAYRGGIGEWLCRLMYGDSQTWTRGDRR
jgi:hypothetical protein